MIENGVIVEMYGKEEFTYHFNSVTLEEHADKEGLIYGTAVVYWADDDGNIQKSEMLTYDSAKVFYDKSITSPE